jgi:rubredoxin
MITTTRPVAPWNATPEFAMCRSCGTREDTENLTDDLLCPTCSDRLEAANKNHTVDYYTVCPHCQAENEDGFELDCGDVICSSCVELVKATPITH